MSEPKAHIEEMWKRYLWRVLLNEAPATGDPAIQEHRQTFWAGAMSLLSQMPSGDVEVLKRWLEEVSAEIHRYVEGINQEARGQLKPTIQ
jgi:hypothetical protein